MTTTYNTHTLPCGLRVIHLPSPSAVVYCGYQLRVGSRDEEPGQEGLAHFCEHATFKGTARRRAWHVLNSLESVGGDLNAFTNKEETVYHAAILRDHVAKAVDVLSDIVFRSTYPPAELEKEAQVVCDEIESYRDSPAELIYDEFENMLFQGHPLGHNILGTAQCVRGFTAQAALSFARRHYVPAGAVFFAYGDISFPRLLRLLERHTEDLAAAPPPARSLPPLPPLAPETRVTERGTHQAHVMVGTRAYAAHHERRLALYLLNNILGGPGLSARLNLSLRERRGLVYAVESTMASYEDTGLWSVYFGCGQRDVDKCLRLVRRELDQLIHTPLSPARLAKAKRQIKGQIGVACDHRESFALDFGKSFLHYGWQRDVDALCRQIDSLTAEDLQAVAADLFAPERLYTLIYQ